MPSETKQMISQVMHLVPRVAQVRVIFIRSFPYIIHVKGKPATWILNSRVKSSQSIFSDILTKIPEDDNDKGLPWVLGVPGDISGIIFNLSNLENAQLTTEIIDTYPSPLFSSLFSELSINF